MSVRPEDVLADEASFTTVKGMRVRKGTIAAAMKNMELLESGSAEERSAALAMIEELSTALVVLGVHHHFQARNPEVEAILSATAERLAGETGED